MRVLHGGCQTWPLSTALSSSRNPRSRDGSSSSIGRVVRRKSVCSETVSLARARYSLLGAGVSLYRVRVSAPGNPRSSLTVPVTGLVGPTPAMPACTCVEIRLIGKGSRQHRRPYNLGGLPAGSVVASGHIAEWSPAYQRPARQWLDLLTRGGWRLDVTERTGPTCQMLGISVPDFDRHDIYGGPLADAPPVTDPQYLWVGVEGGIPPFADTARLWGYQVRPKSPRLTRQLGGQQTWPCSLPGAATSWGPSRGSRPSRPARWTSTSPPWCPSQVTAS